MIFNSAFPRLNSGVNGQKEYKSKTGNRVVILANKPPRQAGYESKIEFYSSENQMLCTLDYFSEDGEHGFGVIKAEWTPDENYFVFSLTSSGGHQSWHSPTLFYKRQNNEIRSLDSYAKAAGISKADFELRPPNTIVTEIWEGRSVLATFRLDSLKSNGHHSFLSCSNGKVIRAEPRSLQPNG